MFRNKLYFFTTSTIRSNKLEKKLINDEKNKNRLTSLNYVSKNFGDTVPFTIHNKTRFLIYIFAAPFIIREVFVYSWNRSLTQKNKNYLDLNVTSIMTILGLYVNKNMINRQDVFMVKVFYGWVEIDLEEMCLQ